MPGRLLPGLPRDLPRDLLADVVDLVVPRECIGCGAPGESWCARCLRSACAEAGRRDPDPRPAGLPPAFSGAAYSGAVRDAVLAHKERGDRGLTAPLAVALGHAVMAALADLAALADAAAAPTRSGRAGTGVVLVPVPTARRAVAARGDDTVALIAGSAAGRLRAAGIPVRVVPALRTAARRRDSAGLGAAERAANLAGAFAIRDRRSRRLPAVPLIVVDDVMTTGATLAAATATLRGAGHDVLAVATVAATQRRLTQRHHAS